MPGGPGGAQNGITWGLHDSHMVNRQSSRQELSGSADTIRF
jgi:hypothetical protein